MTGNQVSSRYSMACLFSRCSCSSRLYNPGTVEREREREGGRRVCCLQSSRSDELVCGPVKTFSVHGRNGTGRHALTSYSLVLSLSPLQPTLVLSLHLTSLPTLLPTLTSPSVRPSFDCLTLAKLAKFGKSVGGKRRNRSQSAKRLNCYVGESRKQMKL